LAVRSPQKFEQKTIVVVPFFSPFLNDGLMYIAPLNYDRFFKKVFSDLRITKRFLEDFLDVEIEQITALPDRHHLTDEAAAVEFDFRCKIEGKFVIIDMQQWYKTDTVKRFYLYHTLNTALQLEDMPLKSIQVVGGKERTAKNYNALDPVLTLIWLADETLGTTQDYLSYALTSESLAAFVCNEPLWQNEDIRLLLAERQKVLALLEDRSKQLDFLGQNRLIYALQRNIIRSQKYHRYLRWFTFAEKSRNKNNKREDFEEYERDEVFSEMIRRLRKENLVEEDFQYIEDYDAAAARFRLHEDIIREGGREEGLEIAAERCLLKGMTVGETANLLGLEEDVVRRIAKRLI
jgi:hypothetical protein